MVKIAVAGGTGQIAREIIDVLVETKKHDILIISRKDAATVEFRPGVTWAKTDYKDKTQLTSVLNGVHTVLCFTDAPLDHGSVTQKMLIDASVAAGVKRYAPNEWSGKRSFELTKSASKSSSIEELPWYAEKGNVRAYMEEINKEKKILEYTLFQPGLLVDFMAPAGTAKHLQPLELWMDFHSRRAIMLEDGECVVTLTTVKDLANVVARAIEYDGEWPVIGGVRGTTLSTSKVVGIGEKVRAGKPWHITSVREEDVRADDFHTPWVPIFQIPTFSPEQIEVFSKIILKGSLLSSLCGSWIVSDDWNRLLPDYKFEVAEEYLENAWAGKA